jgi:prepilin-type N-terminal cleavage/methylation domain-containing protein/prepilin-type processing-associated H-X9-DG protein
VNTGRRKGFTLIELLVVIAIIALLMGILMPALSAAKKLASGAACMGNQRSLSIAWVIYADDNDGVLMCNGACYDTATDKSPWVHRPKDLDGDNLASPAPPNITKEDRYRGIQAGTMWPYLKDVDVFHCPGDNRKSTRKAPRDCFRSYSISYAFGVIQDSRRVDWRLGQYYNKVSEIANAARYYVFVEEEHNGSNYGENEGGWHLPFDSNANRLTNPASWTFYDPLASYHVKSSTFGFADGHAEKRKWRDRRTLEFIKVNAANPSSHSGIRTVSADNEDLRWLIEHFMPQKKM